MSGGSTLFKNFDRRLERELQRRVDERLQRSNSSVSNFVVNIHFLFNIKLFLFKKPKPIKVNVTNNMAQEHTVWLGGSTFASMVIYFLNIFSLILNLLFILEKNI